MSRRPAEPELRIVRCETGAQLAALRRDWSALHDELRAHPFLRWEWLYFAWRRVTPGRAPRVFVARDGAGRLRGVLPLSSETRLGRAHVWRFLGDDTIGSDYLDALAPADPATGVGRRLWRAALADPEWDAMELYDLDTVSPGAELLRAEARSAGLLWHDERPRYRCPWSPLRGTFGEYLGGVGRAENLRRRRRWLEGQPGFAIDVARSPIEVSRALDVFFLLHRRRWAADGGSQAVTDADVAGFHRDATWALAEADAMRLYTLRLGERPLASVYVLGRGPYRALYQSGYDPELARRSPGLVLLARTIEDAFAEGAQVYDFLRGDEPYKREWATQERLTVALFLVRRTVAGSALFASQEGLGVARWVARRLLPDGTRDVVRRALGRVAGRRHGA